MHAIFMTLALSALSLFHAGAAVADSTDARCDIYPEGQDHAEDSISCCFYQAQGHVVITRSDGVEDG